MTTKTKLELLIAVATIALAGCATIPIGDDSLTYDELCSQQRTKCAADGDSATLMRKDRPALVGNDPAKYLGILVDKENPRSLPDSCVTPTVSDYSAVFTRTLTASLLEKTKFEAAVESAVDASIPDALKNNVAAKADLKSRITFALQKNAYTEATYTVYTLTNDFLRSIRGGATQEKAACWKKIIDSPDKSFVWSVAVIAGDGKLQKAAEDQLEAAVSATLDNFKISGAPIDASIKASVGLSIASTIQSSIDEEVQKNNTIYSYGYWEQGIERPMTTGASRVASLAAVNPNVEQVMGVLPLKL